MARLFYLVAVGADPATVGEGPNVVAATLQSFQEKVSFAIDNLLVADKVMRLCSVGQPNYCVYCRPSIRPPDKSIQLNSGGTGMHLDSKSFNCHPSPKLTTC